MPNDLPFEPHIPAELAGGHPDRAIATISARQHGVIDRDQLIDVGLTRHAISDRLKNGRLHVVYRGVYAVGHPTLSEEGQLMAAVRAGRPDAVLTHRSGSYFWRLLRFKPARHDVTAPRRVRTSGPLNFFCRTLPNDEVTTHRGIPVTTVPRTIFDLASVAPRRHVERAMDEAEVQRLTDKLSLPDLLERYPGARGTAVIRAILEADQLGATITRSELEELFIAFLDEHGLPRPTMNVRIQLGNRWIEADCVWHERKVIVELDGHYTHNRAGAFERDRWRDRKLVIGEWKVIRITWQQLMNEPTEIATDLHRLLD